MPNLIPLKFAKKENICKAQSAKLSRNLEVLRLSIEGNEHNWTLREILRFPAAHPGLQKIAQLYVRSVLLKSLRPFFTCTKCFLHTLLSSNTWIIGATVYGIIINQLPDYPEHPRTLDLLCRQEGYNNLYDYLLVEGYMVTEEYEKRVSSHTLDARVFVFEKCVEGYSAPLAIEVSVPSNSISNFHFLSRIPITTLQNFATGSTFHIQYPYTTYSIGYYTVNALCGYQKVLQWVAKLRYEYNVDSDYLNSLPTPSNAICICFN